MKRVIILLLLFINGVGACFGGYSLIAHPNGDTLKMPVEMLQNSPFSNYYIPGLILFWLLGIGSLFVFLLVLLKMKFYYVWTIFIGSALMIWIIIQIIMIQEFHWLQVGFGSAGLILVLLGIMEWRANRRLHSHPSIYNSL